MYSIQSEDLLALMVRNVWIYLHCRCFCFISLISHHTLCDLARYLLVNPDRLDLGLAGDRVDQIHDLPVLAEDPLLNPRNSARRHSSLGIHHCILGGSKIR